MTMVRYKKVSDVFGGRDRHSEFADVELPLRYEVVFVYTHLSLPFTPRKQR